MARPPKTKFQPMLAETMESYDDFKFPVLVSPKIDGIRCVIVDGVPKTRRLLDIPNLYIRELLTGLPPLDGELITLNQDGHGNKFNDIQSDVMTETGRPRFIYQVFDTPKFADQPFSARCDQAKQMVEQLNQPHIAYLRHELITSLDHLLEYEQDCFESDFEGVMVRCPQGPYKFGRSTIRERYLLKIKRWYDAEGEVVGFKQRMQNNNEQVKDQRGYSKRSSHKANKVPLEQIGAFILKMKNGIEVDCGSGLSEAQRIQYWHDKDSLLGKCITFKYQELSKDQVPRFPVFKGFRDQRDF